MYLSGDVVRVRRNMPSAIDDICEKFEISKDALLEMTFYVYHVVEDVPVSKLLLLRSRGRADVFINAFDYEVEII